MLELLLTSAYLPFVTAFVVMIGIGLIEAVGLGFGHLDLNPEVDSTAEGTALGWLGVSEDLPILIWLAGLLGCFTFAGIALQQAATALVGAPLPWLLASVLALVAGLLLNTVVANGFVRIVPGY